MFCQPMPHYFDCVYEFGCEHHFDCVNDFGWLLVYMICIITSPNFLSAIILTVFMILVVCMICIYIILVVIMIIILDALCEHALVN